MRPRTLVLQVKVGGFPMKLGEISIVKFAKMKEPKTILVCPRCGQKPKWKGGYECTCCPYCGKPMERHVVDDKGTVQYKCPEHGWQDPTRYTHWSQLKRVTVDGEEIVKEKVTDGKSPVIAELSTMPVEAFAEKHADAVQNEYGFIAKDETTAVNLKKLLIANRNLGMVIILRYTDTYGETRICLLTESMSKRLLLREIIPEDLAEIKETMRADLTNLTEKDIEEARNMIKMLPKATDETFKADDKDYRTKGVDRKVETPKVLALAEIIKKKKQMEKQVVA